MLFGDVEGEGTMTATTTTTTWCVALCCSSFALTRLEVLHAYLDSKHLQAYGPLI